ncbi:hypothetical protein [Streptomyces cellulosae]|uniref:hypothetical protein n=1 Tax=Streptomyces cellulosae TaxID=1968 RepID=UPI001F32000A|nr:hypothetical protein [Streptomyces cellulosae]
MTMTPAELEAQEDTLEFLNNEVASRLTRESDSLAKIDTKAVFLIGFAATAARFLATHKHHDVLATTARTLRAFGRLSRKSCADKGQSVRAQPALDAATSCCQRRVEDFSHDIEVSQLSRPGNAAVPGGVPRRKRPCGAGHRGDDGE